MTNTVNLAALYMTPEEYAEWLEANRPASEETMARRQAQIDALEAAGRAAYWADRERREREYKAATSRFRKAQARLEQLTSTPEGAEALVRLLEREMGK